jgi:hypothetical protein
MSRDIHPPFCRQWDEAAPIYVDKSAEMDIESWEYVWLQVRAAAIDSLIGKQVSKQHQGLRSLTGHLKLSTHL